MHFRGNILLTFLLAALLICTGARSQSCHAGFAFTVSPVSNTASQVAFHDTSSGNPAFFFWDFGDGQTSFQRNPVHVYAGIGEYFVRLKISNPNTFCIDSVTTKICLKCVFPGDANSDGIINNNDALSVGISYGAIGPLRPDTSTTAEFSVSVPWMQSNGPAVLADGVNMQHSDCDGNGIIERQDVAVISRNYNKRSNKSGIAPCLDSNDIPLYFEVADSISVGDTVSVEVHLGNSQISAQDVYGIAFTINYDSKLIQPGTASLNYGNSQLGVPAEILFLNKDFHPDSKIETAVSRIDHNNLTVAGKIGTLDFVMEENLAQKTYLTEVLNLSFSDVTLIRNDETAIAVCPYVDSTVVYQKLETSTGNSPNQNRIAVYPNPADGFLTVDFPGLRNCEIAVLNLLGKQIYQQKEVSEKIILDVAQFSQGVYFLQLRTAETTEVTRFEISR